MMFDNPDATNAAAVVIERRTVFVLVVNEASNLGVRHAPLPTARSEWATGSLEIAAALEPAEHRRMEALALKPRRHGAAKLPRSSLPARFAFYQGAFA